MKKTVCVLLVLTLCLACSFALNNVYDIFPSLEEEEILSMVENLESIEDSTLHYSVSKLAPANSMALEKALDAEKEDNAFSVGVVSFVSYPEDWKDLSQEEKLLKVFNIMTSISTQEGITYISRLAGYKEKVLMEESYCVGTSGKKNSRIPDPVFTEVPKQYSMNSYQKDNRFGGNKFKLDYQTSEDEVFLSISNTSAMKFMGITCVPKDKLNMFIDAYLTEEGIVIYSVATIYDKEPEIKLVVYTVDLQDSFMRRITGFKDWFIASVN